MKTKPLFWKSLVTGKEYPYEDYNNHGWGGFKGIHKDLPMTEYPYTIVYAEEKIPAWEQ